MSDSIEQIQIGALTVRNLIDAAATNGTHTVIEVVVPPGAQVPVQHSHDAFEETFVGIEGEITVTIEGAEHRLGPGDAVCTTRGQVHGFHNASDTVARFIAVAVPGIFGWAYFTELAEAFASFGAGPPDRAVLGEIMRRHGLTPAPPPPAP